MQTTVQVVEDPDHPGELLLDLVLNCVPNLGGKWATQLNGRIKRTAHG